PDPERGDYGEKPAHRDFTAIVFCRASGFGRVCHGRIYGRVRMVGDGPGLSVRSEIVFAGRTSNLTNPSFPYYSEAIPNRSNGTTILGMRRCSALNLKR